MLVRKIYIFFYKNKKPLMMINHEGFF